MNKIYRIIWSKVKNCYVVASEFAKNKTKTSKSRIYSRSLVMSILACVLSFGINSMCEAVNMTGNDFIANYYYAYAGWTGSGSGGDGNSWSSDAYIGIHKTTGQIGVFINSTMYNSGPLGADSCYGTFTPLGTATVNLGGSGSGSDPNAIYSLLANGNTITYTKGDGSTGTISTALTNLNGNGVIYKPTNTTNFGYTINPNNNELSGYVAGIEITDGYLTGIAFDIGYDGVGTYSGTGTKMYKLAATGVGGSDSAGYTAGNGIDIDTDNVISAKGGTNVTVDTNGINVLGSGSVVSGNAGLISGGTAYNELRPSNGTFVKKTYTTAQNLQALDTMGKNAVKSMTVDGNMLVYTKGDNSSVSVELPIGGSGSGGSGGSGGSTNSRVTTVGSVTAFASNSTPTGYLLCDGRAVSRTQYAELFAKIGTTYGAGNGSTTFNLPNLVNRFVEGSNASGQYIEAGLPNITGKTGGSGVNSNSPAADGAFYKYGTGLGVDDNDYDNHMIAFDASRSNAIYGKSDTVQPEALRMQYYIKVDNSGSGDTPYIGINSEAGGFNEWGEGAIGTDAIAIGKNASVIKNNSVAIGEGSYADEANTISVGHSKTLLNSNNVPIDPDTNEPYTNPSSVTIFDSDLTRRITNVADGIHLNDAVNYGQLLSLQGGIIQQNNTQLISGGTAYNELRPSDGQFIRNSYTTAQNLTALDTMGKNAVKSMIVDGNMLIYTRGDNSSVSVALPSSGITPIGPSQSSTNSRTTTVGSVTAFASNSTPQGYLLCDGRAVSRTKYASLFAKIGTTYGAGDGSTTFNLPNLVGRFVEGSQASGQYINAGLPNITGMFNNEGQYGGHTGPGATSGAFYTQPSSRYHVSSNIGPTNSDYYFDASRSSAIYGRSDTVQPESLMMQYYIKTDDDVFTPYFGVNSAYGSRNEVGDGATGVDAIAIGKDSVAAQDNVISVGHISTDKDINNNAYGSNLYRKIINVADGTDAHDVATKGQMDIADTALSNRIGVQAEDGNYIKKSETNSVTTNIALLDSKIGKENALNGNYTSANRTITANIKALDTKIGTPNSVAGWYTIADNTVNANIKLLDSQLKATEESIGKVNAGMNYISSDVTVAQNLTNLDGSLKSVYEDVAEETVNRSNADIVLGNRIGVLASDGNYIKNSDTNSVSQNLAVLDNQLKATENSSVKNLTLNNNTITFIKGDGSTGSISMHDTTYDSLTLEKALEGSDTSKNTISADVLNSFVLNRVNVEATNRMDADNVLSDRIGTIASNGNYIKNSDINNLSANLILLDNELKNTNTNIEGFARDINRNKESIRSLNTSVSSALGSVSSTSSLVTTLDNTKADASLNNLTATGKQVIANAAINAVQEYIASQQNIATPSAPMMYGSNPNTLSVTNAGNGSLHVGEGSYVNGTSSIAIGVGNQVNANNSGAFGDPSIINADESYVLGNDDTINTGATGSFIVGNDSTSNAKGSLLFGSNIESKENADNSVALGSDTILAGKNSVALGYQSNVTEDNVISVGNNSLKRKIINVADGNISQDSTDAVNGRQLFQFNQDVSNKANLDASNINTSAWSEKLGTGKIQENDTNLVTGGTVFDAFATLEQSIPVQTSDEAIFIGANRTDNMISVYNANGDGRVITGVLTNVDDDSSAANVGYVKSVGESMLNAVNNSIGQLDTKVNKVGANAAAMASLTPASFEGDEKWSLSAGVGNYRGETAGAVGAFYRPAENVLMNVRGSFGNNENMVGAAVSVSLSKGDIPGVTKRQLATTVNKQAEAINTLQHNQQLMLQDRQQDKQTIAEYQQKVNEQEKRINELMKRLEAVEKR